MEKVVNDCNFQSCEAINCSGRTAAISVALSALKMKQLEAVELVKMIPGTRKKIQYER